MSKRVHLNSEILLEKPSLRWEADFLEAARRSVKLHGHWVKPPQKSEEYRELLRRARAANRFSHFVCDSERNLAGVVNINEVVRGAFDSGYLGFYAFVPYAGRGYMRCAGLQDPHGLLSVGSNDGTAELRL